MLKGDKVFFEASPEILKTYFLLKGRITFLADSKTYPFDERAAFVADPNKALEIDCEETAHFFEIQWRLNEEDRADLSANQLKVPLVQVYNECKQYRETFKSPKTISRSVIGHHPLPRFCMGSNESYGPDRVESHSHPPLDQFFFSFPENDVVLLIDDMKQPYGGNTLLHVPLGSNHGVEIPEGKKMHYMWIDFIVDPKGISYLDEVHKPTGVKEFFNKEHRISE